MIKIDFEVKSKKIEEHLKKLEKLHEMPKFVKNRLVAETIKQVKELTPVGVAPDVLPEIHKKYWAGYRGGSLRNAWTYKDSDDYTAVVINPLEYASYVEKGHRGQPGRYIAPLGKKGKRSWVKGKFFLKKTIKNINEKKNDIAKKVLEEHLKKCGL